MRETERERELILFSDYVDLVNVMGLMFQIRDDYLNLQSDQVSIHISSYCLYTNVS